MPIEIKELHIRVSVNVPQGGQVARSKSSATDSGRSGSGEEKDAIVAECVEQVFEILKNKMER